MTDRYAVVRELWEFDGDHGYDVSVLDEWRERFGAVPAALEEYYTTLGAHRALNHTQDQLVAPAGSSELPYTMDEDDDTAVLVFFVENQAVSQWGVLAADADQDDPWVHILVSDEWKRTRDTVSAFLIAQAHLQRMFSWEDSSDDFFAVDDEIMRRVRAFLPPREVEADLYEGLEFFGGPGVVLTHFRASSSVAFACADHHLLNSLLAFFARGA